MRRLSNYLTSGIAAAVVLVASVANATTFIVDNAQSYLTLGANIGGTQVLFEQTPGGLTTALHGTIEANLVAGTSIEIFGGAIGFDLQQVDLAPAVGGVPATNTAPANYGGNLELFGGLVSGPLAGRDFVAEISSSLLPLTGGSFDGTLVELGLNSGFFDYNFGGLVTAVGRSDLSGDSAFNQAAGAMANQVGLIQFLQIPIQIELVFDFDGTEFTGTFDGLIVATPILTPEPGTLTILGSGLLALLVAGSRRFRRRSGRDQ